MAADPMHAVDRSHPVDDVSPGAILRRIRRLARLSQRDLAARAGMPRASIARIESGAVANPGIRTVARLAAVAGFEIDVVVRDCEGRGRSVAQHPTEGGRDLSGRRYPAHVEVVPRRGLWDSAPVTWWGWVYQRSSWPDARRPAATYTLSRRAYFRPELDPVTGDARTPGTILDWEEQQTALRKDLRHLHPRVLARNGVPTRPPLPYRRHSDKDGRTVARIGVFALQGDVREHLKALTAAGCEALPVRRPGELAAVDGLVLPGGESTTMIKLARAFELLEPLRGRIADGLPVYGSCAGMILLADRVDTQGSPLGETIGGLDITVRRNAFGRQVDSFEEDVTVDGVEGGPVRAVFIRAPWVQQLGPAATALAATSAGHVVAVRQGPLLATSFHPEMTGDGRIHAYFCAMVTGDR